MSAAERAGIESIYARYDELSGRPAPELLAPTLSDVLMNAIHAAYSEVQEGRRLRNLRDRLKLAAERCPLCGIGPVTDLDHYLPRSRYKVLSVYCRNLVPVCHSCNNKKRAIASDNPGEQFVHPYFDVLPEDRFLVADVMLSRSAITVDFRIEHTPTMPLELYERIGFQIARLKLSERYRAELNVFLASQSIGLSDAFGEDQNAGRLTDFLLRSAASHEERFSLNDWRAALLRGLAANEHFCSGGFRSLFVQPTHTASEAA